MTAAERAARLREIRASHETTRRAKAQANAERRHASDPRVPGRDHPLRNGGVHRARPRQAGGVHAGLLELLALALVCVVVLPLFEAGGWLALGLVAANLMMVSGIVIAALAIGARLMPDDDDRSRGER